MYIPSISDHLSVSLIFKSCDATDPFISVSPVPYRLKPISCYISLKTHLGVFEAFVDHLGHVGSKIPFRLCYMARQE